MARDRDELAGFLSENETLSAVVMTMGALHEGHRALIRMARELVGDEGSVIVTIFVNPLQFSAGEDLDRYPRTFDDDLQACRDEGVDLVFAPTEDEMYPAGRPKVTVDPGPLAAELEGAVRPDHFAGVLTVVAKLLNLTVPSFAVFGEKDYQQLTLVRQLVDDLEMPYEIVGVPTVREDDGLALSSRNRFLSADDRAAAVALSQALLAGATAARSGRDGVLAAARAVLAEAGAAVDYLELRTPDLGAGAEHGESRLLVAARFGTTRLIDNLPVDLG